MNKYSEKELARILKEYGEDRLSGKIAKAILRQRGKKTIDTCSETDPEKPLMVVKGLENVTRTDMFFTFEMNTEGGNNFIGSGELDGNGVPANFFSDPHVRKGFAYCFNYDQYNTDVLLGSGVRSVNIMLPGMIGYEPEGALYTYDTAKCQEELQASKWVKNADGTYSPSDTGDLSLWDTGFRFTAVYNTGNTARQTAAQILQTELGAINELFVVEVTGLPWPTFLKNQRASKLPIFFSGWHEDIHDPHNWVVPFTVGTYGGRQKLPQEIKDQFQEIINRAVAEVEPEARAEIYKEFNALYHEVAHSIPLYVPFTDRFMQRWVKGWFFNPAYSGPAYWYAMWKE